jgi:hypothetical protein
MLPLGKGVAPFRGSRGGAGIESATMSDEQQGKGEGQEGMGRGAGNMGGLSFGSGMQTAERARFSAATWGVAALIALIVAGVLIFAGRKKTEQLPTSLQPADAYAASLPLSQFAMSESGNLSGGKMTYLDGHVLNSGGKTVTAVTVQVVFENDESMPPQIDTVPLTLIGMTQPYIDVQPVSANPIKPGEDRAFRLIFETVPDNWNQQMPGVRVIKTDLR